MHSWEDLSKLLSCKGMHLKDLAIQTSASVEHFPLRSATPAFAPTRAMETDPSTPILSALPVVPAAPAPQVSVPVVPVVPLEPKRNKEPVAAKYAIDPVLLGISLFDSLYEGAPQSTKHAIEKEVAMKLEAELDTLYKSNNGRSRGWTKVGLESMIKPRCASGGDLKELGRAKKTFLWNLVQDDKGMSAFLDFVCCARRIHCIVMDTDKRVGFLYPAADQMGDEVLGGAVAATPLFLVNTTGHPMFGIRDATELLEFLDKNGWKLQPPHSVVHSLSGLKLDELESVGKRLGMTAVEGNKSARITAIAEFKTRARLSTASAV